MSPVAPLPASPSLPELKGRIARGTVRFFYLPASRSSAGPQAQAFPGMAQGTGAQHAATFPAGPGAASQNLAGINDDLTNWVESACTAVPSQRWQTAASSTTTNTPRGGGFRDTLQLYDCAGHTQGR